MLAWAVLYVPDLFSDDLYYSGLGLVDPESAARIRRFYHREDACRTLIGRLLPRLMLKRYNDTSLAQMKFGATNARKPYILEPKLTEPLAFNVSHDNGLVFMAFAPGVQNPPSYSLGADVMKVRIPERDTFLSFVSTVSEQLTPVERRLLFGVSEEEALKRFFWIWTMKEAYTKALGLGLGFDFSRIEFNVPKNEVFIDGKIPKGWIFHKFVCYERGDLYQGVVAEFIGGDDLAHIALETEPTPWLQSFEAHTFVENTTKEFNTVP